MNAAIPLPSFIGAHSATPHLSHLRTIVGPSHLSHVITDASSVVVSVSRDERSDAALSVRDNFRRAAVQAPQQEPTVWTALQFDAVRNPRAHSRDRTLSKTILSVRE